MESLSYILSAALGVIALIIIIKLLTAPLKWIFKFILNTIIGFVILYIINIAGARVGFSIEITTIKAVLVGIFGIPGAIVLVLLQLFA